MGGHSSGLFKGTQGYKKHDEDQNDKSKPYNATNKLKEHLEKAKDGGSKGVIGGHEKHAFEKKLMELGGKIIKEEEIPGIKGVKSVTYQVPKKDRIGNSTKEMRTINSPKSIYDSNIISTEQYLKRGLKAANNAARTNGGTLPRSWKGVDGNGVRWFGFLDANGDIATLYPIK